MNGTLNETDVFLAAIEIDDPKSRDAYLDAACAGDTKFRQRVEALVLRHLESEGVLDAPPPGLVATIELPTIDEEAGTIIGPYKLLQQIGEGGMGVVFMAEQTEPIQRTVALKIIKPGMDTRQVIARFEAERQAVAMMDHPNIAKVLDAGTTDSGRPYFVMELVKGVPITKYCDEKHLPLRARLELFVEVCQAVQHAHQKGIIHRDIKPNNVLVAEYDNHAVPKVIDFGVAKATAQKLTERTMFTEFGQVLGTMEYMSPEQSKFNQLDIDTRSDIYSLGVMLYELLAGSTPFEGKRLHAAAFDEMLRIIREEEPPKPSTRLSSIDTLPSVAVNRHTEPARLSKDVRGELDWIVMKALEKDRNRRYETASGFAADIQRHLHDEAVLACPPSARYRLGKFARRNRVAIVTTLVVATALLLGTIVSAWQAILAHRARADALQQADIARTEADKQEAVSAFLKTMLQAANPWAITPTEAFKGKDVTVLQVIDSAVRKLDAGALKDRPEIEAVVRETIGNTYGSLSQKTLAEAQMREALRLARQLYGPEHPQVARCMVSLAWTMHGGLRDKQPPARRAEAESLMRDGLAMKRRLFGNSGEVVRTMCRLCEMLLDKQKFAEAEQLAREALRIAPSSSTSLGQLAEVLRRQGKPAEAEPLYRQAIAKARQVNGDGHPRVWMLSRTLADSVRDQGRFSEAEPIYREALKASRRTHSDEDSAVKLIVDRLVDVLRAQGKSAEAEAVLREQLEYWQKELATADTPQRRAEIHLRMFRSLMETGQIEQAKASCRKALELNPTYAGAASVLNSHAWKLATSADPAHRDPALAVELAEKAVELSPENGNIWNTLGVARYRAGEFKQAVADLEKSTQLRKGDSSWDFFFLAMAHWQLGEQKEARDWYGQAIEWMEKQQNQNDEDQLRQLQAEAKELLKITDEKPATKPPVEVK